ncbi:hypothetical protein LDENG_00214050 [Lucifuga dentata]|nr:hypothetical protein LDENG_00214050 [Lucifuga dentata]
MKPMEVWKVGKTFLILSSSSILWKMIVSNVTCMKIEYIRLKHAKWTIWSFNVPCRTRTNDSICLLKYMNSDFISLCIPLLDE